jgi:hypothetical protein
MPTCLQFAVFFILDVKEMLARESGVLKESGLNVWYDFFLNDHRD